MRWSLSNLDVPDVEEIPQAEIGSDLQRRRTRLSLLLCSSERRRGQLLAAGGGSREELGARGTADGGFPQLRELHTYSVVGAVYDSRGARSGTCCGGSEPRALRHEGVDGREGA